MAIEWVIVGAIVVGAIILLGRRNRPRCGRGCDFCPESKGREAPDE